LPIIDTIKPTTLEYPSLKANNTYGIAPLTSLIGEILSINPIAKYSGLNIDKPRSPTLILL
jgi:hypothetical protein